MCPKCELEGIVSQQLPGTESEWGVMQFGGCQVVRGLL